MSDFIHPIRGGVLEIYLRNPDGSFPEEPDMAVEDALTAYYMIGDIIETEFGETIILATDEENAIAFEADFLERVMLIGSLRELAELHARGKPN